MAVAIGRKIRRRRPIGAGRKEGGIGIGRLPADPEIRAYAFSSSSPLYAFTIVLEGTITAGTVSVTMIRSDGTLETAVNASYSADPNVFSTNIYNAIRTLGGDYLNISVFPISNNPWAFSVGLMTPVRLPVIGIGSLTGATGAKVGYLMFGQPCALNELTVTGGTATGSIFVFGSTTAGGPLPAALHTQSVTSGAAAALASTSAFSSQTGLWVCRDGTVNGPQFSYKIRGITPTISDLVLFDPNSPPTISPRIAGTSLTYATSGVRGQPTGESLLRVQNTTAVTEAGFEMSPTAFPITNYKKLEVERFWGGELAASKTFRVGSYMLAGNSGVANRITRDWDANGYGPNRRGMGTNQFPIGFANVAGTLNYSSVGYGRFIAYANTSATTDGYFGKITFTVGKAPTIVFTVDDGYKTDHDNLMPAFAREGLRWSSAIVSDWIGGLGEDRANPALTLTELQALHENPYWEGLNHTRYHNPLTAGSGVAGVPPANTLQVVNPSYPAPGTYVACSDGGETPNATAVTTITDAYEDCRDFLAANGITKNNGHRHLVYPKGSVNGDVMSILNGTDALSGRSTYQWPPVLLPKRIIGEEKWTIRSSPADFNNGFFLGAIGQALASGSDLILFFHRVNGTAVLASFNAQLTEIKKMVNAGLLGNKWYTELVTEKITA